MDHNFLKAETPPEFTLSGLQMDILREAERQVAETLDAMQVALIDGGVDADKAASCAARISHHQAALCAIFSAIIDKREPNRGWFIHNAGLAFDFYKERIDADEDRP